MANENKLQQRIVALGFHKDELKVADFIYPMDMKAFENYGEQAIHQAILKVFMRCSSLPLYREIDTINAKTGEKTTDSYRTIRTLSGEPIFYIIPRGGILQAELSIHGKRFVAGNHRVAGLTFTYSDEDDYKAKSSKGKEFVGFKWVECSITLAMEDGTFTKPFSSGRQYLADCVRDADRNKAWEIRTRTMQHVRAESRAYLTSPAMTGFGGAANDEDEPQFGPTLDSQMQTEFENAPTAKVEETKPQDPDAEGVEQEDTTEADEPEVEDPKQAPAPTKRGPGRPARVNGPPTGEKRKVGRPKKVVEAVEPPVVVETPPEPQAENKVKEEIPDFPGFGGADE